MENEKVNSEMVSLKAGAGKVMITPPAGIPFLGHPFRVSEGTHDDLWTRVLVLEKGTERVVIVSLDLAWSMSGGDYIKIRDAVETATGIEGSRIMVSSTHNHSGPVFRPDPRFGISLKRQRELIDPWVEKLPGRIAEAARKAVANLKPGRISFGKTLMTGLGYNRRKAIPDGAASLINISASRRYYFGDTSEMARSIKEQYVHWGMSPEEAEEYAPPGIPDGPIDPDLDVILIEGEDGKPIAILVNFALQAVSCSPPVPLLISGGFPGFMERFVEDATGAICLFTAGACGDIRPYRSIPRGFEEPERIGFVLASGVLKAVREAEPVEKASLRVASEMLEVNLRKYPPLHEVEREIAEKKKLFEKARAEGKYREARRLEEETAPLEFARGPCELDIENGKFVNWIEQKKSFSMELQAVSIGDLVLLGIPNLVNVSLGLDLKKAAWTKKLLICSVTNGFWWYLLKKEEYEEGAYESAACRLAPGSGEKVIAAASALVKRMRS